MLDQRRYAPATQRNREPILALLQRVLPPTGTVLEVASGTGEHSVFFAPRLQPRQWLPTDCEPEGLASIRAWQAADPAPNLEPPLELDVSQPSWPATLPPRPFQAVVSINLLHISPWSTGLGLLAGAGALLPPGGILYLYGPFKQDGQHTAPSNAAFDRSLRAQNPAWGVRDLETVIAAAADAGLDWVETAAMPANNLSVICRHR